METSTIKSIFDYFDYRLFLKDTIHDLRQRGKYSVRKFAERVGFKSCGYLTMVLNRSRNLSKKSALKVAEGLHLNQKASSFFMALVGFNQAEDAQTKDFYYNQLLEFKKFRELRKTDASQYELFSHWYNVAVLEALGTELRFASIEKLAGAIRITTEEVQRAIKVLSDLGFIQRDGNAWKKLDASISTEPQVQSLSVRKFHREMISKALKSVDEVKQTDRELSALTISLSPESFERVRKRVFDFQNEISLMFSEDSQPDRIYQINFQVFPVGFIREP